MKTSAQLNIKSATIEYSDLKQIIEKLVSYLENRKFEQIISKVSFHGKTYSEEYNYNNFPQFQNFKEGLELININIKSLNRLEITIVLSSNETNPFVPFFSKALIETDDNIVTNGILDEISSFIKRRNNFSKLFHSFGIPISLGISFLIFLIFSYYFKAIIAEHNLKNQFLLFVFLTFSFPIKKYLRWLFPYIYFVGENKQRTIHRMIFYGIIIGLLANFIFLLLQNKIPVTIYQ